MTKRIAVYPGTFDPMTLGHLDIVRRGANLADTLVIGVTTNPSKEPMFSVAERLNMVRREIADIANVEVVAVVGIAPIPAFPRGRGKEQIGDHRNKLH